MHYVRRDCVMHIHIWLSFAVPEHSISFPNPDILQGEEEKPQLQHRLVLDRGSLQSQYYLGPVWQCSSFGFMKYFLLLKAIYHRRHHVLFGDACFPFFLWFCTVVIKRTMKTACDDVQIECFFQVYFRRNRPLKSYDVL